MAYLENMKVLKELFPALWERFSAMEEKLDKDLVRAVSSKKSSPNLLVRQMLLHDENNPIQEAKNMIKNQKIDDQTDILFYGIGLGYHINAFIKQYPQTPFSLYEPVPEIFYQFLCYTDLEQIPRYLLKNIYVETLPEDPLRFCSSFVKSIRNSITIIEHPAYRRVFGDKRNNFLTLFDRQMREHSVSVNTNSAFQKRWTQNSSRNFMQVLKSPNILLENHGCFKNKPAIIAAAGPSLEDELENLRVIKEKGLAYLFSVGSALNTLVKNDIFPDAACTYDPTEKNQIVCQEVLARGIQSIPLFFGSTVGHETLEKYPGPKMHMLISQDSLAAFYLKPRANIANESIHDATTIAVITLQLLYKLGFNPIILVGQNLAYREGKIYAAGSTFHPPQASKPVLDSAVFIEDVYGQKVASNHTFMRMKQQIEIYLSQFKDVQVINTTKDGAYIAGTIFQTLDELMESQLQKQVVEDNWLELEPCSYDMDYLRRQNHIMIAAQQEINQLMENCQQNLTFIGELASCGDAIRIGQSYEQFNLSMEKLRNNPFFAVFITPMNRVELEFLMQAVPGISSEREPVIKAQMMEKEFRSYLQNCEQDIKLMNPIFLDMSRSIEGFCTEYMVLAKASRIRLLLLDCDGILTDGFVYYSTSGDELRKFSYQDCNAIFRLQKKGIQTLLINPEANPLIASTAGKMGMKLVEMSIADKEQIIAGIREEYKISYAEMACVLNDLTNLNLIKQLGLSFAVKDSAPDLQNNVDYVLTTAGGQGAIAEIAQLFLNKKAK